MKNRRSFLKDTTLFGAGVLLSPSFVVKVKGRHPVNGRNYAGELVPVSVIDDSCTLAFASGKAPAALSNNLAADVNWELPGNKGRLATVIPAHDKRILQLLDHLKEKPEDEQYHAKVAIAFGFAAHCGCSEVFGPVMDRWKDDEEKLEAAVYQDAALLRALSEESPEHARLTPGEFNEILRVLLPRAITRTHTLKPDYDDGPGWVNRMAEWRKSTPARFEHYARVYADPDPAKLRKYVSSIDFYQPEDEALQACRELQTGAQVKPEKLDEALSAKPASLYGQAVVKGYRNILMTADYLTGKEERERLAKAMKLS